MALEGRVDRVFAYRNNDAVVGAFTYGLASMVPAGIARTISMKSPPSDEYTNRGDYDILADYLRLRVPLWITKNIPPG